MAGSVPDRSPATQVNSGLSSGPSYPQVAWWCTRRALSLGLDFPMGLLELGPISSLDSDGDAARMLAG